MARHCKIVLKLIPKTGKPEADPVEQEIKNLRIEEWSFVEVDEHNKELRRFSLNDYWRIDGEIRAWDDDVSSPR